MINLKILVIIIHWFHIESIYRFSIQTTIGGFILIREKQNMSHGTIHLRLSHVSHSKQYLFHMHRVHILRLLHRYSTVFLVVFGLFFEMCSPSVILQNRHSCHNTHFYFYQSYMYQWVELFYCIRCNVMHRKR